MTIWKTVFGVLIFITIGCASKKQIYADRLLDNRNRHLYVNDSLDFLISYFDVIGAKTRQTDSLNFKKTKVPIAFQEHLKSTVKRPSEILFQAHRMSLSDEDIIAVLYENSLEINDFSSKIVSKLTDFIPKDSLTYKQYETSKGYWINSETFKDMQRLGSDFIEKKFFNSLKYNANLEGVEYKFHEFHVPFNERLTLRLIWIANVKNSIENNLKNTKIEWRKVDEQNHYLELFSLSDSAKFRLKEIVPKDFHLLALKAFEEKGYLGVVDELESYENTVEKKGTEDQKNEFYQEMMIYQSFLGNHKASLKYLDKFLKPSDETVEDNYFEGSESHNASTFITQKVENERVVIFNEAHTYGQHRAFLRDILRGLYEKGFRHLALETLNPKDNLNDRDYPLRTVSGFYSDEPTFGQMLREAKSIGFQLWSYENTLPSDDFRELEQAKNLKKIMDKFPNEKFLIWVGHGHIYESTEQMDFKMMASYLKKLTGINPYTIEQTMFKETSQEETDPAIWKVALKKWQFKKPIVITKKDTIFVLPQMKGIVDMQVFFPRTDYTNDYPNWMGNSENTSYDLNIDKEHFKGKLLKIFLKNEYKKEVERAIPVMNIPLNRIGNFTLFLKPEKYVAVIRDNSNWEFFYKEFEIKVDIQTEISQLTTETARKDFLTTIFKEDQRVRQDSIDATVLTRIDALNLVKIDRYLAKYGYPSKAIYGEIAAYTPWTVIHHNGNLDIRESFFPILFKAWKDKDIKTNSFYLYLNRSYQAIFGKSFKREASMTDEEEINKLILELGYKH
jgi:hypothetical protein